MGPHVLVSLSVMMLCEKPQESDAGAEELRGPCLQEGFAFEPCLVLLGLCLLKTVL